MWDLPRPGLEPVSPALAGRFSTTAPPGKPSSIFYYTYLFNKVSFLHGIEFLTYNIPIYILLVGGYLAISFDIKIWPLGVYPPDIVDQLNKRYEQACALQHYNSEKLGSTLFLKQRIR